MPEGWKRLDNRTKNDLPTHALGDALSLMKEMAEALHIIRTSADHGLTGLNGYKLCADKALKKFEEWK